MPLLNFSTPGLFRADRLSWVMAGLIVIVIATVTAYSSRYMAGDRKKGFHHAAVLLLGASVLMMVFGNHLLLLLAGWTASNLLLVCLMIHKREWAAARNAGLLALRTFALGTAVLAAGFWLLADGTGSHSIHQIVSHPAALTTEGKGGLFLIMIAAMTQSAAWPFHRWLTSSLNSPTPVSALMHAGLVNGGGFLLARFAPLYLAQPALLHFLFSAGLITATAGTFWKLLQPDVKRMLACSTIGQMGFMLMQCGMGLFAPAVSHLCWHGLFKAYLFLSAGSVVQEKRSKPGAISGNYLQLPLACLAGVAGAWAFTTTSGIGFNMTNTDSLMAGLAFIAATQLALRLLGERLNLAKVFLAPLAGLFAGCMYGLSVLFMETVLDSQNIDQAQPLDGIYLTGFGVLFSVWVVMNTNLLSRVQPLRVWKRLYMTALNASQPHPETITSTRTAYQN